MILSNADPTFHARIDTLIAEGRSHRDRSEFAAARDCLTQALDLSRQIGDPGREADSLISLGGVHWHLSDYYQALSCYRQAQDCLKNDRDPARAAAAANGLGTVYSSLGDFAQAMAAYDEALGLQRTVDDPDSLSNVLNNIGALQCSMGDRLSALRFYNEGLELSRSCGNAKLEASCLGNIADTCTHLKRHDEALAAAGAAVAAARRGGARSHECRTLLIWGSALTEAGQAAEALPLYTDALAIAQSLPDPDNECAALNTIGEAALAAGRLDEAGARFGSALEIAERLGTKPFALYIHQQLSEVYRQQGDPAAALTHYQRFHALEREVFSEEADRRTKSLMIRLDVERSQKEAEIHRLRNVELVAANTALEEAGRRLQEQAELLEAQAEELRAQNEELLSQSEALERQATEDGLTGLANRRHLESRLSLEFYQARQNAAPLTVVMADVDHFKQVNDRFGHQIGDKVLMTVARLIKNTCRASDLAARYGGEEFVLALPDTDANQAHYLCERLRQAVETYPWTEIHPDLSLTLSLGLSDDLTVISYERLLGLADSELYAAKHTGRNRISPALAAASHA